MRRAKDLSQESFAWKAGINRSYMAKIEIGATWAGLEIICKLADAPETEPAEITTAAAQRACGEGGEEVGFGICRMQARKIPQ
jgi:transcriptional regulator with XRE-family HTH domain